MKRIIIIMLILSCLFILSCRKNSGKDPETTSETTSETDSGTQIPTESVMTQDLSAFNETIELLNSDKYYTVAEQHDREVYSILKMKDSRSGGFIFVSVDRENGGYAVIDHYLHSPEPESTLELVFDGKKATITLSPFAGPFGANSMITEYELDKFSYSMTEPLPVK